MFDVFDILVPELSADARIEVRSRQTAFGQSDERTVYVSGVRMGEIAKARNVCANVEAGTGAMEQGVWTVLIAAAAANDAAAADATWVRFLDAFVVALSVHQVWMVTCESDCEQHPLEKVALSPDSLAKLLDSHRRTGSLPISFQASEL